MRKAIAITLSSLGKIYNCFSQQFSGELICVSHPEYADSILIGQFHNA